MTNVPKDEDRLRHMLDAAKEAVQFLQGRRRSDLDTERQLALSVVHLLEILGEAASNISEDFRRRHSDIPWSRVAGTRNRLIHGYFDIDLDIVWKIVTTQLPPLISHLEKIVKT